MSDQETLERRLSAVERTITADENDFDQRQQAGELAQRVDQVESTLDAQQRRIEELEAATQALRGYVGNVRAVNSDVEQRADAAVAAVDRLQDRLDGSDGDHRPPRPARGMASPDGGVRTGTDQRRDDCDDTDDGLLAAIRARL